MIKKCILCGKLFETNYKTRNLCYDKHYNKCVVCGKEFEVNNSTRNKLTCSKECMKKRMSQRLSSEEVRCKTEKTNLARYGTRTPGESDQIKQKVIETSRKRYGCDYAIQNDDIKKKQENTNQKRYGVKNLFSSKDIQKKCRNTLQDHYGEGVTNPGQSSEIRSRVIQTTRARYGVDNVFQSHEIRSKIAETNLERYGSEVASSSSVVKEHMRQTCMRRYGAPSTFQSPQIQAKIDQTNLEKYGTVHPMKNEEVKQKNKASSMENNGGFTYQVTELIEKCKRTSRERYGTDYPIQSDEIKQRRVESNNKKYGVDYPHMLPEVHAKASYTRSQALTCDGTRVDSNYEKQVYDFLLKSGISFSYQSDSIEYEYQGKLHSTIIDFKIGDLFFEVKGGHLMNGCFDYQGVPIDVKLDVYRKHHVIVITDEFGKSKFGKPNSYESNGLKYLNKCSDPLIGIDINLFDINCPFPYRDDRPHCFYDVKVDGQKSAHEAFYDLNIRWKMILNRIMYSGGFIDAKQVLNALNITRTCKQPSWFSKQLAKDVIMKYCSSNTIVDPFAGWGARADACNELHRSYIGVDFNEELVKWHHQKGRTNIMYGDATDFKYNSTCSVFICPPYSDPETGRCFEDYNFDGFDEKAKALSQCDWMRIVMKNIPNAFEYILVCKIVDEGWDKFIVDTKKNSSHFGLNNEYILCISNEDSKQLIL